MLRTLLVLLTTLSLWAGAGAARAEPRPAHGIVSGERILDVTSSAGHPYRLFVSVPDTLAPKRGFPVAYVLDGNSFYASIVSAARQADAPAGMRRAVIVGVGYPTESEADIERMRFRDLTTPAPLELLSERIRVMAPELGGLEAFQRFLIGEAKRHVEEVVPIDHRCEVLLGHSLSGLAVLHALYASPEAFDSYVAASPSIWWSDRALLLFEPVFLKRARRGEVSARVFLFAGEQEQSALTGADAENVARIRRNRMIDNARELAARLSAVEARSLSVRMEIIPGAGHGAAALPALVRGMQMSLECANRE